MYFYPPKTFVRCHLRCHLKHPMKNNNIIIRLHEGRIWFNSSLSIDVESSNLPFDAIPFKKIKNVYWLAEQLAYDKNTSGLTVAIKDYFLRETSPFGIQNPKSEIHFLNFANLGNVTDLKLSLEYYRKELGRLDRALEEGYRELDPPQGKAPEKAQRKNLLFRSYPEEDALELKFDVWFKDAEFKLGYIAFDKNIAPLKQMARFRVDNDFLLPEFEYIKGYFTKALGSRKFDVTAKVITEHGKIVETRATSHTINKINEQLIDSIKNIRTFSLVKVPLKANIDKSLFTADELFGELDDIPDGNVFSQSELDILRTLLEKHNVRNRRQLEFLAGVKQAPGAKLKFTLHPHFGFLFTVQGERMVHFIWELLNSHATYIWSLDKGEVSMARQFRRVEDAINQVRNSGREQYKHAWRSSHLDQDLVFHVIHHEEIGSSFIDGFVKWRHRLGEILV